MLLKWLRWDLASQEKMLCDWLLLLPRSQARNIPFIMTWQEEDGFRKHHPNLTLRTPQPLSYSRALSDNHAVN